MIFFFKHGHSSHCIKVECHSLWHLVLNFALVLPNFENGDFIKVCNQRNTNIYEWKWDFEECPWFRVACSTEVVAAWSLLYSLSGNKRVVGRSSSSTRSSKITEETVSKLMEPVSTLQQETKSLVQSLQRQVVNLQHTVDSLAANRFMQQSQQWLFLAVVLLFQTLLQWLLKWSSLFYCVLVWITHPYQDWFWGLYDKFKVTSHVTSVLEMLWKDWSLDRLVKNRSWVVTALESFGCACNSIHSQECVKLEIWNCVKVQVLFDQGGI